MSTTAQVTIGVHSDTEVQVINGKTPSHPRVVLGDYATGIWVYLYSDEAIKKLTEKLMQLCADREISPESPTGDSR